MPLKGFTTAILVDFEFSYSIAEEADNLVGGSDTSVDIGFSCLCAHLLRRSEVTAGELNTKDSGPVFDKGEFGAANDEEDLYRKAVEIVRTDKKASTSYVQRKLRIGYNRAANLIERMEDEGVVSAQDRNGRREIIGAD